MSASQIKYQKYNIFLKDLFNLILTLNPEEQRFLQKNIEKFIFKEKRKSARKACRIPVSYFYNERIYNNFIINISRDGCFIETKRPLLIGEKILMDIKINSIGESIKIKGEVANANRLGMGIEFVDVSNDMVEKLGYLLFKSL